MNGESCPAKKRIVMIISGAVLCAFLIGAFVMCGNSVERKAKAAIEDYNQRVADYNSAATAYNESLQAVADANIDLDTTIGEAQALLNSGVVPFEMHTKTNLEQSIAAASQVRVTIPDPLALYEELVFPENASDDEWELLLEKAGELTAEIDSVPVPAPLQAPDYSAVMETIVTAKTAFEDSVRIQLQVTAPSDEFVLERLKQVDTILSLAAVTKNNDPNGLLGKEGGYIGCIYFSDSRVDKDKLDIKPGDFNVITMGTVGGGAVEIYATVEEAEARNAYLSTYDDTELDPGSHIVVGTMVIRISSQLTEEQQSELTAQIVLLLTTIAEEYFDE